MMLAGATTSSSLWRVIPSRFYFWEDYDHVVVGKGGIVDNEDGRLSTTTLLVYI